MGSGRTGRCACGLRTRNCRPRRAIRAPGRPAPHPFACPAAELADLLAALPGPAGRGGAQGRRRRDHAAAAVGRRPGPAAGLAGPRPAGRRWRPAGAARRRVVAGPLAGAGPGLRPGRRAGPAPRGRLRSASVAIPGVVAAVPVRAGRLRRGPGRARPGAAGPGGRGRRLRRPVAPGARRRGRAARGATWRRRCRRRAGPPDGEPPAVLLAAALDGWPTPRRGPACPVPSCPPGEAVLRPAFLRPNDTWPH